MFQPWLQCIVGVCPSYEMTHPINRQLRPIVMLLHLSQQSYKKVVHQETIPH